MHRGGTAARTTVENPASERMHARTGESRIHREAAESDTRAAIIRAQRAIVDPEHFAGCEDAADLRGARCEELTSAAIRIPAHEITVLRCIDSNIVRPERDRRSLHRHRGQPLPRRQIVALDPEGTIERKVLHIPKAMRQIQKHPTKRRWLHGNGIRFRAPRGIDRADPQRVINPRLKGRDGRRRRVERKRLQRSPRSSAQAFEYKAVLVGRIVPP